MEIRPHPGPQTAFLSTPADVAIMGGAAGGGKSVALLLEAARNIHNPEYGGVIFRREQTMITNEGGLRDTSLMFYPYLGGEYRSQPYPHYIFPSGARVSFRHLNQENDVLGWLGSQIPFIGFDEINMFTQFQFWYMFSRLRSTSGVRPYIRGTTNPDADSWVADLLEWWIDQDPNSPNYGFPIPERSGVIRYFVRINNELHWGDSIEELVARHGCDYLDPKSFTFIPAKITDNPTLLKKDPAYLGNLKALARVERARLLDGNWKVRPQAGDYFPRDAVTIIDWRPTDVVKWIRSWDLAATEEGDGRDPDWTVGLLIGRRSNGKIVVAEMIRVRRKAAVIESLVKTTAVRDGKDVWILLPQDPGQSGKSQRDSFVGALYDYTVLSRTITKNKVAIASSGANSPASLWQQGQVEIVRAPWNKDFIDEMDAFPTKGVHDDICFIEGTMIATEFGEVCIEDVKPGILVWTRSGWMEVVECQVTSECSDVISVEFSNGIILTGTPNHPIICEGDRIVELQNLSSCDKIIHISDTFYGEFLWVLKVEKQIASIIGSAKWLSTMVFDIIVTQTQKIMHTGAILLQEYRQNKTELTCCTDKYGKIISERLKKDTISITKMEIQPTTTYQISNALLQSSIFIGILKELSILILKSSWSIFRELEKKRKHGIVAKSEENGTGSTLKIVNSTIVKWLMLCVRFAEKHFKQCEKEKEIIAQLNVKERTVKKNGAQERNSFIHLTANNAEKSLRATKQHQYFAHSLAQQEQTITFVSKSNQKESKKVYNLRVNGKHEYFANGILVHNCDSFSTCVRQLPGHAKPDYSQSGLSGTYRPLIGKERAKPRRR